MTRQSIRLFLIFGVLGTTFFIPQTGCNSTDERYFERLDSLEQSIQKTNELLNIDFQTIRNRRDLINQHMLLVNRYVKDSFTLEFGNSMAKYKSIRKTYDRFLDGYRDCKEESNYAENQAKNLRADVKANVLAKDSFKVYYAEEMKAAEMNLSRAKDLVKPLHSVEPDYQRISSLVDEKLQSLAKQEPELRDILNQNSEKEKVSKNDSLSTFKN